MAAKVFFLFVAVFVLFEAEAAFYRREFFDPGSPFMRDLMEDDDPISRRTMQHCADQAPAYCAAWKEYCNNPEHFVATNNFRTFTEVLCKRTCGRCYT